MRAGRLNKRVTLQKPVESQDDYGGTTTIWSDVATRWAGVEPLRGQEYFEAQAAQSEIELRVVIRHDSTVAAVDSTWRVQYGTRSLEVVSAINSSERDEQIELMCKERTT